MMNKVKVKCCYSHSGCVWEGEYSNVTTHLSTSCNVCPECLVVLKTRADRDLHMKKTCIKYQVRCLACQQLVFKDDWNTHVCLFPCRIKGCTARVRVAAEEEHLIAWHSPKEIVTSLVTTRYQSLTWHPMLTNVRCACGDRMVLVDQTLAPKPPASVAVDREVKCRNDADKRGSMTCMDCATTVGTAQCRDVRRDIFARAVPPSPSFEEHGGTLVSNPTLGHRLRNRVKD